MAVTIACSVVGALGDSLSKLASTQEDPLRSRWFFVGFGVSAATAFVGVFVMRNLKLTAIGVVSSVSTVLLRTGVGVVQFRAPLNRSKVAGLVLAVAALVGLARDGEL